jgi:hypothetical protein
VSSVWDEPRFDIGKAVARHRVEPVVYPVPSGSRPAAPRPEPPPQPQESTAALLLFLRRRGT